APQAAHALHVADLSAIGQVRRVGAAIAAEARIDALLNNAGAVFTGRTRTIDGLAPSFATNHLACYALSLLLLPRLQATPGARIVCTSSRAHAYGRMDFARLQRDGIGGYAQSKLANLLFMRRLAQLLGGGGVTVNALHPGFVATRFADNCGQPWRTLMRWRKRAAGLTPEQGARTLIHLAVSPAVAGLTGGYYVDCRPVEPSPAARSDADALRLWQVSAQLTGLDFKPAARTA
ncbi:MAG: SDR family NAD(P)-dependent oxidoreductase, partial [Gammaproteobacteria bacterium]|nr:SDR family NAD(P)-dependent oxidoreductase [Gammaproteobacteria bacterium]